MANNKFNSPGAMLGRQIAHTAESLEGLLKPGEEVVALCTLATGEVIAANVWVPLDDDFIGISGFDQDDQDCGVYFPLNTLLSVKVVKRKKGKNTIGFKMDVSDENTEVVQIISGQSPTGQAPVESSD